MTGSNNEVVAVQRGRIGHLLLNRPSALNALNLGMIRQIDRALRGWQQDDAVEAVVVTGEGDRAFCAGVDVKGLFLAGRPDDAGERGLTDDLFRAEYTLNHFIANYTKPYVAFLDGITMGGGVGISVHGSHRIANERTRFAMPETGIGLFPDVGGSFFLSRLGPIGLLLGLTGEVLDPSATKELGFATHVVNGVNADDLVRRMSTAGVVETLSSLASDPTPSPTLPRLREIADRCFDADSIESVVELLGVAAGDADKEIADLAMAILDRLQRRSPTSLKVTMEQLRRGKTMSLSDCLVMEYRLSQACLRGHDFFEGVRAVLIDKDQDPKWSPDSIAAVDSTLVEKHFQSLGERDLVLPD